MATVTYFLICFVMLYKQLDFEFAFVHKLITFDLNNHLQHATKVLNKDSMFVAAIFIMIVTSCLFGLFVHLVMATRADSRTATTRLRTCHMMIQRLDNATERTFDEFQHHLDKSMKFMFMQTRRKTFHNMTQNDQPDLELGLTTQGLGTQDEESQTDLERKSSLPPLMVRPAVSSDVVLPISG